MFHRFANRQPEWHFEARVHGEKWLELERGQMMTLPDGTQKGLYDRNDVELCESCALPNHLAVLCPHDQVCDMCNSPKHTYYNLYNKKWYPNCRAMLEMIPQDITSNQAEKEQYEKELDHNRRITQRVQY